MSKQSFFEHRHEALSDEKKRLHWEWLEYQKTIDESQQTIAECKHEQKKIEEQL